MFERALRPRLKRALRSKLFGGDPGFELGINRRLAESEYVLTLALQSRILRKGLMFFREMLHDDLGRPGAISLRTKPGLVGVLLERPLG